MDKELEEAWEYFNKMRDRLDEAGIADPISEVEMVKLATVTEACKRDVIARSLVERMMVALTVSSLAGKRGEFLTMCKLAYQVGMGMLEPVLCDKDDNKMPLTELYEKDTEGYGS